MLERVLITGGAGQLGSDLRSRLLAGGSNVMAPSHAELDIADDDAVRNVFAEFRPTTVFNCAAFHNLEVCETEEHRSFEINARAVKRLAEHCDGQGAKLVHLSTNYVFDGTGEEPYAEDDVPRPRSVYAISKLAGERCALSYATGALVVRSAGLYGEHGSASKGGNFVTRVLRRATEEGSLRMVADQRLSPTYTADLAPALIAAVEASATGLLHLTAGGECSWYEFTQAILDLAGVEAKVEAVATEVSPGGVDRPLNGVLSNQHAEAFGLTLRPWNDALADYVRSTKISAAQTR